MRPWSRLGWAACVLALLAVPALAATKEIQEPGGAFSLSVPQDWTENARAGLAQAQDPKGSIRVEANASGRKEQSLDAYAAWAVRMSQKDQQNWKEVGRRPVQVSGLPGILVQATYTDQGRETHEDNYLVLTPNSQLILIAHCPMADHEANKAALQAIADSWTIPGTATPAAAQPPAAPLGAGQPPFPVPQPPPQPQPAPFPQPQPFPQPAPQPQPFPQPFPQPGPGGTKELKEPSGVFSVSVPADWIGQAAQGIAMAGAPGGKASLMVMAMPKILPTQQAIEGVLQSQKQLFPGWTQLSQEMTQVAGRQAAHIRAEAQVMNVPTVGDYYFIETEQAIVVLTTTCAKDALAQYQGTLQQVQASLRVGAGAPQLTQPGPFPQPQPQPFPPQPQPGPGGMKHVTDQGGAFSLSIPGDWQVQQQAGTAAAMEPTGRCSVGVMAMPKAAQTADQFAQVMLAAARQNMQAWQQVGTEQIQVAGRPSVHVRATAQVMNNSVVLDYIFLVTDTRQVAVVFTYMAQEAAQRLPQMQQILQTLRVQ